MLFAVNVLRKLSEKDLREKILLPLFTEMGYQQVAHNHHAGEKGKDFVLRDTDRMGNVTYISVVVKVKHISGSVSDVGEVATQVKQSLGSKLDGQGHSRISTYLESDRCHFRKDQGVCP